jgi:hypothetical protein
MHGTLGNEYNQPLKSSHSGYVEYSCRLSTKSVVWH